MTNDAIEQTLKEFIPIADLHLDPANARRHPDGNIATIKASLARFGQQTPVVIDANNVVRKGNGTLVAARDLGWSELWYVRTDLNGVDATAYAIVDNRSSEKAEWDDVLLAETLQSIRSEPDFPIEATGFDDREIDELLGKISGEIANGSGDDARSPDDFPEHDEDIETQFKCPKCSYVWSGSPQ